MHYNSYRIAQLTALLPNGAPSALADYSKILRQPELCGSADCSASSDAPGPGSSGAWTSGMTAGAFGAAPGLCVRADNQAGGADCSAGAGAVPGFGTSGGAAELMKTDVVVAIGFSVQGGGVTLSAARQDVPAFVVHDGFSGIPPPHLWKEVCCFQ